MVMVISVADAGILKAETWMAAAGMPLPYIDKEENSKS